MPELSAFDIVGMIALVIAIYIIFYKNGGDTSSTHTKMMILWIVLIYVVIFVVPRFYQLIAPIGK